MTTIRKIVTSKIDGDTANNTDINEIRPFGETAFYLDQNFETHKLTLMMFDGQRTHRESKVLAPGVLWGSNADSGDGNNYDTIKLIPDAGLHADGSQQYLIIDPTTPSHIHLRAGGPQDDSGASLYIGGENSNLNIPIGPNPPVLITANSNTWTFGTDGQLTIPKDIIGSGDQDLVVQNTASGVAYLELPVDPSTNSVILANQAASSATVTIRVGNFGSERNWTFNEFGALAVPSIIYNNDTSNVGQLLLAGDAGEPATYLALPSDVGSTSMNVRLVNSFSDVQLGAGNNKNWYFKNTGELTLPNGSMLFESSFVAASGTNAVLSQFDNNTQVYTMDYAVGVQTHNSGTYYTWLFNNGGDIQLPRSGLITETIVTNELWGTTTTSLTLVPAGAANGTQRLEIYSTGGGEGDHIHITSGDQNQTDLFLGNDTQYFAVAVSGVNYIQARPGYASPSPGISAGPGANVNIYAGNAGDNGGNVADGNSGGNIFIASGISSSGLGGDIFLQTSSGPSGFGSIKLSTDGGSSHLIFDKDDTLTFPSGGDIVFDSSSTSYIYGVTGIEFANGTTQTTAFTGTSALLDITNTNGIDTTYYLTFVENRSAGQEVRADVDLTFNSWSNTLGVGNVTTGILKIEDGVHEKFQTKADAIGTVTHDCASGHIFYHTSPDNNWTANFTNLNLNSGYATAVTLVIVQGGTGYYPSAVQIGGVGQTLNWQGNTTPTPSTNRTDVVTFSIINNSGTYTVLGQLTGF